MTLTHTEQLRIDELVLVRAKSINCIWKGEYGLDDYMYL
jgi:hypothetical protein